MLHETGSPGGVVTEPSFTSWHPRTRMTGALDDRLSSLDVLEVSTSSGRFFVASRLRLVPGSFAVMVVMHFLVGGHGGTVLIGVVPGVAGVGVVAVFGAVL